MAVSLFSGSARSMPALARSTSARRCQQLTQDLGGEAAELAACLRPVEDGDFQIALGQRLVLGDVQGADAELQRLVERHAVLVMVLEKAPNLLGLAAHGRVVPLVLDRT